MKKTKQYTFKYNYELAHKDFKQTIHQYFLKLINKQL